MYLLEARYFLRCRIPRRAGARFVFRTVDNILYISVYMYFVIIEYFYLHHAELGFWFLTPPARQHGIWETLLLNTHSLCLRQGVQVHGRAKRVGVRPALGRRAAAFMRVCARPGPQTTARGGGGWYIPLSLVFRGAGVVRGTKFRGEERGGVGLWGELGRSLHTHALGGGGEVLEELLIVVGCCWFWLFLVVVHNTGPSPNSTPPVGRAERMLFREGITRVP